jgi:hypothetical protein
MAESEQKTCAHTPCQCPVEDAAGYCSDYCRKASSKAAVTNALDMAVCTCAHVTCMRHDAVRHRSISMPSVPAEHFHFQPAFG